MNLTAGTRLGRYEVVSFIAAGGMGEVYRARDPRLGRDVAVKILPASMACDAERLQRFEYEAQATSALNHPNILVVFDIGSEQGRLYIVTELLEGETIKARLCSGRLSTPQALEIARQIAAGLMAAHGKGIVHRDIKPSNLFLTLDGRLKILDFGLARMTPPSDAADDATGPLTPTNDPFGLVGTAGYISPEQVRGQAGDARSDVFAFGAVLHEMLAGQRAFTGTCAVETLNAVLKQTPTRLDRVRDDVPEFVARIVERCLEKNPRDRFQTARDLAFALEAASTATFSRATSAGGRKRWPLKLRSWLWIVVTVVLVALIFLLWRGVPTRLMRGAAQESIRSLAVLPLENVSGKAEEDYFVDGLHGELIAKLAKIGALRVISRTSVERYRKGRASIGEIARALDVDAVLEGSVMRMGDELRTNFRLVDARTDEYRWAESYQTQMHDVLQLQSVVAKSVAEQIEIRLTPDEERRLVEQRVVDPEAYQLYLQGRFHWSEATPLSLERSAVLFREAIARDPGLALARVGLVESRGMLGEMKAEPSADFVPQIESEARRAVNESQNSGEAHAALGFAVLFGAADWNWDLAERELKQAVVLSPSNADAHAWYSQLMSLRGRHAEAIEASRRAQKLDPLNSFIAMNVASRFYYARRFDEALEQTKALQTIHADYWLRHWIRGLALSAQGRRPDAIAELRRAVSLSEGSLECLPDLGAAFGRSGRTGQARAILDRLERASRRRYVPAYYFAVVHAGMSEKQPALDWLERAYAERDWRLAWIGPEPTFDSLRSEARFQALLTKLHLAVAENDKKP
jgi:TolB-like protein/Flp pilus assembly protein TadD